MTDWTESFGAADSQPWGSDQTWSNLNNMGTCQSGKAAAGGADSIGHVAVASFSDGYVQVEHATSNTDCPTPIGRCDGTKNNFYWTRFHPSNGVEIWKRVGGTYSTIDTTAATFSANSVVKMEMTGTTIKSYYGGVLKGTVVDTAHGSGTCGLRGVGTSTVNVSDNWEASDGGDVETPAPQYVRRAHMTGNVHR